MKDIHDVIKHTKFGDDRLRGSGVVAGQISAFPIDFAGRPYNTLTLPCERVIIKTATVSNSQNVKDSSHANKYLRNIKINLQAKVEICISTYSYVTARPPGELS